MKKKSIFDPEHDVYLDTVRMNIKDSKQGRSNKKLSAFMRRDIAEETMTIIPEGYGGIVALFLFITLPEILGLGFFFFYVSGANPITFNMLNIDLFLSWAIGYEILAVLMLLIVVNRAREYLMEKK